MKKVIAALTVLSLAQIFVVYSEIIAEPSITSSSPVTEASQGANQDYFFGVKNASSNLNQVLALLVGPAGQPGPVGVVNQDGLVGIEGVIGKDGLPGAPGAAGRDGRDGTGVLATTFTGAQGTCTNGGIRFVDSSGSATYACNGASGPAGSSGPAGPAGPAGSGGGGSGGGIGTGTLVQGSCETDNEMYIGLDRDFTGTKYTYNQVFIGKSGTAADIKSGCAGKWFTMRFTIPTPVAPRTIQDTTNYVAGNEIVCTEQLQSATGWPTGDPQITLGANIKCRSEKTKALNTTPETTFRLSDIDVADTNDVIGFELATQETR
jgi:hypothetical protein